MPVSEIPWFKWVQCFPTSWCRRLARDWFASLQPAGNELAVETARWKWQVINLSKKAACERDQNEIWVKLDENVGGENTSATLKWLLMFESRKHFHVCFKIMYFNSKGPALERGRLYNFTNVFFLLKWNVSVCLTHMIISFFLSSVFTATTLFPLCLRPELRVGDWNIPPPCVLGAAA